MLARGSIFKKVYPWIHGLFKLPSQMSFPPLNVLRFALQSTFMEMIAVILSDTMRLIICARSGRSLKMWIGMEIIYRQFHPD